MVDSCLTTRVLADDALACWLKPGVYVLNIKSFLRYFGLDVPERGRWRCAEAENGLELEAVLILYVFSYLLIVKYIR